MTQSPLFQWIEEGSLDALANHLAEQPEAVKIRGADQIGLGHAAVGAHREDILELLLDAGLDPAYRCAWGADVLEWAVTIGARSCVALLIRGGMTHNLWTAAGSGEIQQVTDKVQTGRLDTQGRPFQRSVREAFFHPDSALMKEDVLGDAFYISARNGFTAVARFLHEQGADINSIGYFGASALHWAALKGHLETVSFLIQAGARLDVRDPHFQASPKEWAHQGNHEEIAALLP